MKNFPESLRNHRKSLSIYHSVYGEQAVRPQIALAHCDIACAYMCFVNYVAARAELETASTMLLAQYGEGSNHPDVQRYKVVDGMMLISERSSMPPCTIL